MIVQLVGLNESQIAVVEELVRVYAKGTEVKFERVGGDVSSIGISLIEDKSKDLRVHPNLADFIFQRLGLDSDLDISPGMSRVMTCMCIAKRGRPAVLLPQPA